MIDFQRLKANSFPHKRRSLPQIREALQTLELLLTENQELFVQALDADFQKPKVETLMTEVYPLLLEVKHTLKNLKKWSQYQKIATPLSLFGTKSYQEPQAKGCCLIISPWNYPVQLALGPMIPAIAAGNTICLKPSEITTHTAALLKSLIEKYFPPDLIQVQLGGVTETEQLLQFPFDHIFFTGSTAVGKKIMAAAAQHLSSVTLELGGKSPTIIDEQIDLKYVAKKISWGKFLNAGQTCVAPDYVFVPRNRIDKFKAALIAEIKQRYETSPHDLASIVSSGHHSRLQRLLENQKTEVLLPSSRKNYFSPTLVINPDLKSPLMQEEIFGPILPILAYDKVEEVLAQINSQDKPLALYLFSKNNSWTDFILKNTSSGGVCLNDQIIHLANHNLPFGGVGPSGMGAYHGYAGFREFSHHRSILKQSLWNKGLELFYAPYTDLQLKIIQWMIHFKI